MEDRRTVGRTWRPGRGVRGTPPRSGTAGGREVECPGQGRDNRSIIEIVVETQLQTGYTVSPSGARFTSPFFLLAALLDPEKSHLAKKPERNTKVTSFADVSENCVKGCEALGYEIATGSPVNDFRYVGEQVDPNSGFYYLRARWMDPEVGRFASVDPFAGRISDPLSLHRYLYAGASPISFSDPSGRVNLGELNVTLTTNSILNSEGALLTRTAASGARLALNRSAGKAFEAAVEAEIREAFPGALIRTQRALTGPGGKRIYDLLIKVGDRIVIIESKTKLPMGGSAFRRLLGQIATFENAAQAEAAGAEVLVVTEEVTEAALTRISAELGVDFSPQVVKGTLELVSVLRQILLGI